MKPTVLYGPRRFSFSRAFSHEPGLSKSMVRSFCTKLCLVIDSAGPNLKKIWNEKCMNGEVVAKKERTIRMTSENEKRRERELYLILFMWWGHFTHYSTKLSPTHWMRIVHYLEHFSPVPPSIHLSRPSLSLAGVSGSQNNVPNLHPITTFHG